MVKPATIPEGIFLTDRTTIETDWECGMKRWWYKHEGGRGIVPTVPPEYFTDGGELHDLLAFVATAKDPREVFDRLPACPAPDQLALEKWARLVGWVTAFVEWVEPGIRENEETIATEAELILDRSPLWIASTPDRITRRRVKPMLGELIYREWKTTGAFNLNSWADYWPHAVQLHTGLAAAEEEYGAKVAFGQVRGFTKGHDKDGKLRHPYVWAYWRDGEWSPEYKYGWDLAPTWDYPGGPRAWALACGVDVARTTSPLSRSIFLDRRLVESLVVQRIERERLVAEFSKACYSDHVLREAIFESRFSKCRPQIGAPCIYASACHNASVNENPLKSGEFVVRDPHHDVEKLLLSEVTE